MAQHIILQDATLYDHAVPSTGAAQRFAQSLKAKSETLKRRDRLWAGNLPPQKGGNAYVYALTRTREPAKPFI